MSSNDPRQPGPERPDFREARAERRRRGQSAVAMPSVSAQDPDQFLTLGELRDLVEAADAQLLPDEIVVRGNAIPFRMVDLGNPGGSVMKSLALSVRPDR